MMTRENAMRKIRSLVNLASPGSGATPAEASTAKTMSLKLMREHGLTPADFRPPAAARPAAHVEPFFAWGFSNTSSFGTGSMDSEGGIHIRFSFNGHEY